MDFARRQNTPKFVCLDLDCDKKLGQKFAMKAIKDCLETWMKRYQEMFHLDTKKVIIHGYGTDVGIVINAIKNKSTLVGLVLESPESCGKIKVKNALKDIPSMLSP